MRQQRADHRRCCMEGKPRACTTFPGWRGTQDTCSACHGGSQWTDIGQKCFMAFIFLIPRQSRTVSVRRAARALLSGLGEHETQTFLFHLTNRCSFQEGFSNAQAGDKQTCRGMIQAGRQQIHQAELTGKGGESLPAAS